MAQVINNVPPEDVGEVVQSMITNDNNTNVTATQDANGNFTIRGE